MGTGYGPRLNEVLRSYMHARLAGVIRGAETVEFYRKQREVHDGERPVWGDTAQSFGLAGPLEADVKAEQWARAKEAARLKGVGDV